MADRALLIDPRDDLVVALSDLASGEEIYVEDVRLTLQDFIPAKHKFTRRRLPDGSPVRMYGVVVGRTTREIQPGSLVSRGNLVHETEPYELRAGLRSWSPPDTSRFRDSTFDGFVRSDGRVGTANHWIIVPLVFCENRNVDVLRDAFDDALGYGRPTDYQAYVERLVEAYREGADVESLRELRPVSGVKGPSRNRVFPNVSGLRFLTHGGGCGGTRQDAQTLCALLAAYIDHPNVAGATVLSLGCQNAQVRLLNEAIQHRGGTTKPVYVVEQQRSGTEDALMTEAIQNTFAGLIDADRVTRDRVPLQNLTIGVECGGSDGFSGISANPAIGHAADLLVALGGSVLLSEFPELSGVEQELIDRCVSIDVAQRFVSLQEAYADQAAAVGVTFDSNPSEGNIRDGLLTDAMKSAGAARKGGSSPITDVLDYPESVRRSGLSLLCTPGNDVESTTGLAAAGAQVILFSTGLGTPTGNPIVPVIKVASNSSLARTMPDIIDLDAGPIVRGEASIREVGENAFQMVLDVASGRFEPAAVRLGQHDFLPWKRGISL